MATDEDIENVRTEYREVCNNHRAISDFRGKLLTLLPMVSGVGIYALLPKEGDPHGLGPKELIAIGVFGVVVTLGLFFHELRGIEACGQLIDHGKWLEGKMNLREGQFHRESAYYHEQKGFKYFINNFKGAPGAAWIIYPSVILAWLFVAALGLCRFHAGVRG
jgi:hypothetical protein